MVVPAPEEDPGPEDATPPQTEDSDSGESYEASPDDASVSTGDIEVAVRVAHASEAFSGKCFRCSKVTHRFRDEEYEMYDPDFLNLRGACEDQPESTGPRGKEDMQASRGQGEPVGNACFNPNASSPEGGDGETKEGEVMTQKAHTPSSKKPHNPSPTHLPA